ncbi:MAG: hypothetical protein WD738_19310 [Pirellulales bacterium]
MIRLIHSLSLLSALLCVANSRAGQPYVVSESENGHIWRIEDANGDGDALDVGERTLWGEGFTGAHGMTTDSRAVYVAETGLDGGSNQIVRLFDANGDDDALDVGERIVWLDGLDHPRDISFDTSGAWYLSEFDNNQIWLLVDSNNDNDVHDVGEKILFADGISGPQWILPQAGTLLVAAEMGGQIHRLADLNGDGDALDVAENLVVTPNYNQPVGLLDDGNGGFYFSSFATDTVYHAHDRNGDGDMLDVAEVLSYADFVYGLLDGPVGLTAFDGGGFLLADLLHNQLRLVRDTNGDGDALDLGDVLLFADGFDQPIDIVALPIGLPGDFNFDGTVDAADYVVWRKGLGTTHTPGDYDIWRAHFGETGGSGSTSFAASQSPVPEPACSGLAVVGVIVVVLFGRHASMHSLAGH